MDYTFISYSRKQLYFAESVVLALQRAGLDVWFDLQKLSPGIDWSAALKDGFENCKRLVFIASQAALESPYVRVEWETALDRGREVIVVLSEAVQLPEQLQTCAIYDARVHFDETIQNLAGYLNGVQPARHDFLPAVEKSVLKQKMPFMIWLTASVLYLPTITVWLLSLLLPLESAPIDLPAFLNDLLPRQLVLRAPVFIFGFLFGLSLAQTRFPAMNFLQHTVSFENLKRVRLKLLQFWLTGSAICLALIYFGSGFARLQLYTAGVWVVLALLLTLYWSFWVLPKSADLLRWFPAGEADQDIREFIQATASAGRLQPSQHEADLQKTFSYTLHYHPADARVAQSIASILKQANGVSSESGSADAQFILVSNRTSMKWLLEQNASLPGRVINILITNIHTRKEIQDVLARQWVDFRNGRVKIIQALAAEIGNAGNANGSYALQVSPLGFSTSRGFPRSIRLFFGVLLLLHIVFLIAVMGVFQLPNWVVFPLSIPILLYIDALIMRRSPLPGFLHRIFGFHLAWFADAAEKSPDAIGNSDRYFVYDKEFLLLVDVLQKD